MVFRTQFSEDVKNRTVESPKGVYQVCLEGYFDFNEAMFKLMASGGSFAPVASQFEPDSDSDDDDDLNFSEPKFDDELDAVILARDLEEKFIQADEAAEAASKAPKKSSKVSKISKVSKNRSDIPGDDFDDVDEPPLQEGSDDVDE